MRKRHFIDQINDKTSKTMKNENCDVNVWVKVEMRFVLHAGLRDVDLIMCNKKTTVIAYLSAVPCCVKTG